MTTSISIRKREVPVPPHAEGVDITGVEASNVTSQSGMIRTVSVPPEDRTFPQRHHEQQSKQDCAARKPGKGHTRHKRSLKWSLSTNSTPTFMLRIGTAEVNLQVSAQLASSTALLMRVRLFLNHRIDLVSSFHSLL
jgi:hypothetical protein